ncbi:sodium:solute symporter family transporter [Haloplanus pelagicus]|jgi:sodium/proline symporter|uniref:sodium:solute symporter family transporter n=1 Tax=Haloplanus pelagicus TaxID=2949995 RepID=UPI00203AA24E|nr:sodium/proline symporter [Haloplanus sp. HW8-1]
MAADPLITGIVVVYLLLVLGIGVWGYRQTESTEDFLISGKRFGIWAVAFSAFASIMSGFGFIGGPGLFYSGGYAFLWIAIVAPLAFPISWFVLGKKMRLMAEVERILTIPDAADARYDSDAVRFFVALSVLLGVISYLAVQLKAMGFVLADILGTSELVAVVLATVVIAAYTIGGGMIAGVFTDLVQGGIMVVGSILVFFFALDYGGGFQQMSREIATNNPEFAGAFGSFPVMLALSWYFLFTIGNSGQPHMAHKLYMIRDVKLLKWGAPIAGLSYFLSSLMMLGIGISVRAGVETGALDSLSNPDMAAPFFLSNFVSPVLAGIVFAAALGAIMSTSDAFINIGAANLARDIPESLGMEYDSDRQELWVNRLGSAAIIVLSLFLAYFVQILVGILGVVGWALFAAPIVPLLGIGLNWSGATREGALAAVVVSLLVNLGLAVGSSLYGVSLPHGVVAGAFSLVASSITLIVVSLLTNTYSGEDIAEEIYRVVVA